MISRTLAGIAVAAMIASACTSSYEPASATPIDAEPVAAPASPTPATPIPAPTAAAADPAQPVTTPQDTERSEAINACARTWQGSRIDVKATGNRVSELSINLADAPERNVELSHEPTWIIATESGWHVELADGSAVAVTRSGEVSAVGAVGAPPVTHTDGSIVSAHRDLGLFNDPLGDGRVVQGGSDGVASVSVALTEPTDRYAHGVLGDAIEAGGFEIVDRCTDERVTVSLSEPDVIEGISAMLGDIDGDGEHEVLVTVSNSSEGARLAAWSLDGGLLAESLPIGRGNRWRNQLAIAPVGPTGEIEVIDVRTPHIGGSVEYFRLNGDQLERVATSGPDYTSHSIGSRNLDLAIVADGDNDGGLDVLVPLRDRLTLAVLERVDDGVRVAIERSVPAPMVTNLAPNPGSGQLAVGLADGRLVIFG